MTRGTLDGLTQEIEESGALDKIEELQQSENEVRMSLEASTHFPSSKFNFNGTLF